MITFESNMLFILFTFSQFCTLGTHGVDFTKHFSQSNKLPAQDKFAVQFHLHLKLRCDERFTHAFTACDCILKKLRWLAQTMVITLKTQLHAVNAR